jgi:biofilm PGA synthesis N-glycosyltransferase PgaC
MVFPLTLSLLSITLYVVVMCALYIGLLRLNRPSGQFPVRELMVCVVVPFRNESANLPGLVKDLSCQSYPGHLYSVILVNDHSTDHSKEMAVRLTNNSEQISCIDLPEGKQGKKAAISYAVSQTRSTWILQIDADCRMGPGFVSSHISFLERNPSDMVSGMVTTGQGTNRFLSAFERLDILGIAGAGAGSYHFGRPLMCSGANLLYSRRLFEETGRFDPDEITPSGDDMFLLIAARKLGKKFYFNADPLSLITTGVVNSWRSLIAQRIRWGGKSGLYRMRDIQFLAMVVAFASMAILLIPAWLIWIPESRAWLLPAAGGKIVVDFLMLAAMTGRTGQRDSLWWYIPVLLVYYPFMVLVVVGSLLMKPEWKERGTR